MTKQWLLIALLTILMGPAGAAQTRSLHILLTNDDGYDSLGVKAVADVLQAAGHRLTIVAPLGQRSGSGMKITLGELAVVEQAPGVWSVDASPADAVSIALNHIMKEERPDLIVSGANFGQNLGANVMISGTVGAAMMGVVEGIPAIAVSVGLNLSEAKAEPHHFPSTIAAFPAAARLTLAAVNALAARTGDALLPAGHMLNINYPASAPGSVVKTRWAPVSRFGGFRLIYPSSSGASLRSWIEVDARAENDGESDTALFAAGHATISVLKPDWNGAAEVTTGLRDNLAVAIEQLTSE